MKNMTWMGLFTVTLMCVTGCFHKTDTTPENTTPGSTPPGNTTPGNGNTTPTPPVSGLQQRPVNTKCVAGKRPATGNGATVLQRVFPNLAFNVPLGLFQAPGDGTRWYVIEKNGRAYSFANDNTASSTSAFLDLTATVDPRSEGGLLGMAFHPNYNQNRYVYVFYTTSDSDSSNLRSVISRFTVDAQTNAAIPASEHPLLTVAQPYDTHKGGNIAFGPDGYLYIGLGDGGSAGDPEGHGQDTRTLLGAMLRIDVNADSTDLAAGRRYKIPSTNPFPGTPTCLNGNCPNQAKAATALRCSGNGCPEIFAWGLRNPWRWSFDRVTGDLWVGDVGQNEWEEIDLLQAGKNYGWNCYEGNHKFYGAAGSCGTAADYAAPVTEYDHGPTGGNSVTGGYVYRGASIPALTGVYIFTDFGSGRIWGLFDPKGTPTRVELTNAMPFIASFGQDHEGELYALRIDNGYIYKFVPGAGSVAPAFASKLSETGCADEASPAKPSSGMIPYDVISPLWSDGAAKRRWLALPEDARIDIGADNDWSLPAGSVLRKDFVIKGQIVETRLLAHHTDGDWAGYSYEWDANQTDATLVPNGKIANTQGQDWYYPSGADCLRCHSLAAGRTLGPKTNQLNFAYAYAETGVTANQIHTFTSIGLFSNPPAVATTSLPALVSPLSNAGTLEQRAKAYLDANCSHCHRPGGSGRGAADFRYEIAFADMHVCNENPTDDLGVADAKLLVPGDATRSVIALRMRDADAYRMPPLATLANDIDGIVLVEQWINALTSCP